MPALQYVTVLNLPIGENGALVECTIQDAEARELIAALGNAVKWLGVTTTELVDNVTTSPIITVGGESVTAEAGGMTQYNGEEFVYSGTTWQSIGKNNFGNLAFKSSASGSYTPAGDITVVDGTDTTASVTPFGTAGTAPSWTMSGTVATFNPGAVSTAGTPIDVVTQSGARTATFAGTAATITVT